MRKICMTMFLVLFLAGGLQARQGTSIALMGGIPTGVNFKSWLTEQTALNVNFGYDLLDNYLFMNFDILPHWEVIFNAPFYLGGGLCLEIDSATKSANNYNVGVRGVGGWEIFLGTSPLSLFFEGGGFLEIYKTFQFIPNGSVGVRYYISH